MRQTTTETSLSMNDFTSYFEQKLLGRLYFPNGIDFCIDLNNLYKLISGWKINHTPIIMGDIIAIISFGSAVRHPGLEEIQSTRWNYLLFGKKVTTVEQFPIQPNDADFLVITGENLTRENVIKPILPRTHNGWTGTECGHLVTRGSYGETWIHIPTDDGERTLNCCQYEEFIKNGGTQIIHRGSYGEEWIEKIKGNAYTNGIRIKSGSIDLVNRGASQLLNGVRANDTVSISALREGVPIFFDDRFSNIATQTGVERTTPRKISWDENDEGFLTGRIQ